jgi:ribosomal protein S18 acetylase RimI-like enzyme
MIDRAAVQYRNVNETDYTQIEDIEGEEHEGEDQFIFEELDAMFAEPNRLVTYGGMVAEYNGKVIAYMIYMTPNDFPKMSHIIRLHVSEDVRRQGVGSRLIERIEPTKTGYRVTMEVPNEDYAGLSFLKSVGYVVTSVVESEYDEDGDRELEGFFILANEKKEVMEMSQRLKWRAN